MRVNGIKESNYFNYLIISNSYDLISGYTEEVKSKMSSRG